MRIRSWKSRILLLAVLFAFTACRPWRQADACITGERSAPIELRCYYLQDQKYAVDQDPESAQDWKAQLHADMGDYKAAQQHYDLFSHAGGGPLGAEWNSDGDLCVLVRLPVSRGLVEAASLTINGKHWLEILPSNTWQVIDLPYAEWHKRLRPIGKSDYIQLYDKDTVENFKGQAGSPLGIGEMLDFRLRCKLYGTKTETRRAFHIACGE